MTKTKTTNGCRAPQENNEHIEKTKEIKEPHRKSKKLNAHIIKASRDKDNIMKSQNTSPHNINSNTIKET